MGKYIFILVVLLLTSGMMTLVPAEAVSVPNCRYGETNTSWKRGMYCSINVNHKCRWPNTQAGKRAEVECSATFPYSSKRGIRTCNQQGRWGPVKILTCPHGPGS